jgi:hypothetical protein
MRAGTQHDQCRTCVGWEFGREARSYISDPESLEGLPGGPQRVLAKLELCTLFSHQRFSHTSLRRTKLQASPDGGHLGARRSQIRDGAQPDGDTYVFRC